MCVPTISVLFILNTYSVGAPLTLSKMESCFQRYSRQQAASNTVFHQALLLSDTMWKKYKRNPGINYS